MYLVVIQSTVMALLGGRLRWHRMIRTGAASAHARTAGDTDRAAVDSDRAARAAVVDSDRAARAAVVDSDRAAVRHDRLAGRIIGPFPEQQPVRGRRTPAGDQVTRSRWPVN